MSPLETVYFYRSEPFQVFSAIKRNYGHTTTTAVSSWWEALENNNHLELLQSNNAFYCRFYSVANNATDNIQNFVNSHNYLFVSIWSSFVDREHYETLIYHYKLSRWLFFHLFHIFFYHSFGYSWPSLLNLKSLRLSLTISSLNLRRYLVCCIQWLMALKMEHCHAMHHSLDLKIKISFRTLHISLRISFNCCTFHK